MTKISFSLLRRFVRCKPVRMYNLRKGILYTARTVTMTQNCCSRYSPYTLTEWSFRHGETAIGLSVSPEVRQPFSARRSVAKTCSGG